MNDNLEKTILDLKTPGLNNPETYVLTLNRFNTYMVLIFCDLKKAQIYKIPYRSSPHQETEMKMKKENKIISMKNYVISDYIN